MAFDVLVGLCSVSVVHLLHYDKILPACLPEVHAAFRNISGYRDLFDFVALRPVIRKEEIPSLFSDRHRTLDRVFVWKDCFSILLFTE